MPRLQRKRIVTRFADTEPFPEEFCQRFQKRNRIHKSQTSAQYVELIECAILPCDKIKFFCPTEPQVQPVQPVEVAEPASSPKEVTEEPIAANEEEAEEDKTETEKPAESAEAEEQRAETPHDESDYEDNITVTVPPAHAQSGEAFRDFHLNGRGRHMESSKHHHIHVVSFSFTGSKVCRRKIIQFF